MKKSDQKDFERRDFGIKKPNQFLLYLSFENIVIRLLMDCDPCFELLNNTQLLPPFRTKSHSQIQFKIHINIYIYIYE
jgi:hypothetical protein